MTNFIDLTGQTFHHLTAIRRVANDRSFVMWECRCKCGNIFITRANHLKTGNTKSCGCWKLEALVTKASKRNYTHGLSKTPTYHAWQSMFNRCNGIKPKWKRDYTDRGITVCARWEESFENFLEDMGVKPPDLTLDRIDNDKGYFPENCRWTTRLIQMNNTRKNCILERHGKRQTLSQWARELRVDRKRIRAYIKNGGSLETFIP